MADSSTPLLQLVDQETGNNENTWGDILDANLLKLENAIAAGAFIATTGGALALSDDQARNAILLFTTGLTSNSVITVPTRNKAWIVRNAQSGNDGATPAVDYTLTIKTAAGTGTVVRRGETALVYCDGANVYTVGLAPTVTGLKLINATDAAAALAALGPTALGSSLFTIIDAIALYDATASAEITLASASTVEIGKAADPVRVTSKHVRITGTTSITSFGVAAAGVVRYVTFAGVLILTNGANLTLPSGANITTAAGDVAMLRSNGSGSWTCLWYSRATGQAVTSPSVSGRIGQVQRLDVAGAVTCTAQVPYDDTKPQTSEMNLVGTQAFTPQNAGSTLLIEAIVYGCGTSSSTYGVVGVFEGASADPLGVAIVQNPNNANLAVMLKLVVPAASITARNYLLKVGVDASTGGTFTVNGVGGNRLFGGAYTSFLMITEILP